MTIWSSPSTWMSCWRASGPCCAGRSPARPQVLRFADLALDTGTRQASRGERVIALTAKEYELLELFMRHPRQVLTRE